MVRVRESAAVTMGARRHGQEGVLAPVEML